MTILRQSERISAVFIIQVFLSNYNTKYSYFYFFLYILKYYGK
ncbi:hypothetical protein CLOSYM_04741 [[Clostridium] symbiosum ATCC 14940]|uniref:Uncharacterized protein n=1 Tax=[Clostridium] symbiosum ATCC 14940 TaxID=411472 RepID=A0ABC9TQS5_CLOSY|nr:hypothetical protein CLOSYM_04741 [[Clostridium] symbiosum ATCC 14940]